MNYKELEQEVKRLEEQIKDLKVKLEEKAERQPYEVKVPEDIENYYYVDELGEVHSIGEKINYYDFEKVYQRGLAFKTREEAEQFDKERILINRAKDWAKKYNEGWTPNWEGNGVKWHVVYETDRNILKINWCVCCRQFTKLPYFKSEEIAELFIKEFGDEIKEVLC